MRSDSKIIISLLCTLDLISCTVDKPEAPQTAQEPIAQVQTFKLQKADISKTLRVYGTVLPWPDKLQTVSVAYASRIESLAVTEGQLVQKGELLLTLNPGDDTALQLEQAQKEQASAVQVLQLVQERLDLKLATRQELNAAQLRAEQANTLINNLLSRGVTARHKGTQKIKADHVGIIHQLSVQAGQIVPANSPLLQWLDQNQSAVRLSIEPEDVDQIQGKQPVLITPVNKPTQQPVSGVVETISHQIDPVTRLLNVWVSLKQNHGLLINDFVEAQIILSSTNALVAPKSALLPDGNGYRLFTVENGHAVQHQVQTGQENDTQIEIIADDIKEQDDIVALGNYELEDGMAVRVQQP
jgi:RND family efflux transporter MFP subunit